MNNKTEVELKNFFIFNTAFGAKEGEEHKKILFYHPIIDNTNIQIKNVGLVEGIVNFTNTFKPSESVSSLHTTKERQLYLQPEKNFWMVMSIKVPTVTKTKENTNNIEYLEDNLQDNVFGAILKETYFMFRLFWGTFQNFLDEETLGPFKSKLELFFNAYIKSVKLENADILNIFSGIQYLPLDKQNFLKVQCFVNALECNYEKVVHTAFLFNDHLIWSGIEPSDMQTLYRYLIGTLLPANMETEVQGGSMPRNCPSPFAALRHGRFITGPCNLKNAKTIGKVPKVYLYGDSQEPCVYHLLVYRVLGASVCLFVKGDLTLNFFKEIDAYMSPKLSAIVSDIADYCTKQVVTPSSLPENTPRFIYFNKLNLAYKSTVHLDNKQTGNIACTKESLKIMADIKSKNHLLGHAGEIIVKTISEYWVVCKTSNSREFYIALQEKNANLMDISDEVKKICDNELQSIFFHSV